MILLEIGNSTIKVAHAAADGSIVVERYSNVEALLRRCEASTEDVLCAPVGQAFAQQVIDRLSESRSVSVLTRASFARFVGSSYDTPQTLGLDRILNLLGLDDDGIAVSCGTAITVDGVIGGQPRWGAILPGFRTASDGLHERIPVLPRAGLDAVPRLPARTSADSVVNGVLLATALAVREIARMLANDVEWSGVKIVVTGGDAPLLGRLWRETGDMRQTVTIDDALLFRGMLRAGREELG
jgi:pantothenate kinase type III